MYPPADPGLPILGPVEIVSSNAGLLHRLNLHAAVPEDVFRVRFTGPLERLAAFISVLPGTATGLFSGQSGLFRAALEMGFYAFQSSDGRIFTGREGVERRHALEGRWRYLCFLAGLLYPLGRTLERAVVTSDKGAVWKRHFGGISTWADEQGVTKLFVSWASTSEDEDFMGPTASVSALVPLIAGPENLQMLDDGTADLVAALLDLSTGSAQGTPGVAHHVIASCWDRVRRREEARRPQAFGRLTAGTHQGPYLIGAIRTLVERGDWKINESCLRADVDGLYLYWPDAAHDLIAYGRETGIAGWPDSAPTLAELLKGAGIVLKGQSSFGFVGLVDDAGEIRLGLQFANPLAVVEDFKSEDYALRAPRTLSGVLSADPISRVEVTAQPQQADGRGLDRNAPKAPVTSEASAPEPETTALDLLGSGRGYTTVSDSPGAASHASATMSAAATPKHVALREARDVKFSDLVPEEIANQIGNALQIELLGKVVKAWRDRGSNSAVMRRIDEGAAIAMSFLAENMRDAVTWVDVMAKAGMVYAPPDKRGMRVQKVSIPEGRAPVNAVVLNNFACKRLGL